MHAPDNISNGQVQWSPNENEDNITRPANDLEEKIWRDQETETRVTAFADHRGEPFSSVTLPVPDSTTNHQGNPLRGTYSTHQICF